MTANSPFLLCQALFCQGANKDVRWRLARRESFTLVFILEIRSEKGENALVWYLPYL